MRTKLDVEKEILELSKQIDTLSESRIGITQGLRKLKAQIGGRVLPPGQFQSVQSKRLRLTADMDANLAKLRQIKAQSRLLHEEIEELRSQPANVIPKGTIEELVSLRDYYQEYAADQHAWNLRKPAPSVGARWRLDNKQWIDNPPTTKKPSVPCLALCLSTP